MTAGSSERNANRFAHPHERVPGPREAGHVIRSRGYWVTPLRHVFTVMVVIACTGQDVRHSDSVPGLVNDTLAPPLVNDSLAPPAAIPPSVTALGCLVTDSSIGPIRLGMTFAEARAAMPAATVFERATDGEGAVLVAVTLGSEPLMTIYAEDDEEGPIDWRRRISGIETMSTACSTVEGIHPASLVVDAERVFGKTRRITLSEVESRQFIEFERQPRGLTFRLDYSGVFEGDSTETVRFEPDAKIFTIAISVWGR